MSTKTSVPSTQQYINIAQIRNGIIVTKTGQLRAIMHVVPVNFTLKSEEDQEVLIGQYQNFLNALSFPIQIVIHSRRLDVTPYLLGLQKKVAQTSNELLRFHAMEYIEFVRGLTEVTNIMDKQFYCVVGYDPPSLNKSGLLGNILGRKEQHTITFSSKEWTNYTQELNQRVQLVVNGLSAIGLISEQLNTQKSIELYYSVYNPEEATTEKLTDVNSMEASIISTDKSSKEQIPGSMGQVASSKGDETHDSSSMLHATSTPIPNQAHALNEDSIPTPATPAPPNPVLNQPQSTTPPITQTQPSQPITPATPPATPLIVPAVIPAASTPSAAQAQPTQPTQPPVIQSSQPNNQPIGNQQ